MKNVTLATEVVEPGILVYLYVLHGLRVLPKRLTLNNESQPFI